MVASFDGAFSTRSFFDRSAWPVRDLAHYVAVLLVTALNPRGELHLIVGATLLHKSGKHVWNIGWFHDAVASTEKRVVTALGNKWVVLGLVVPIPGTDKIFCLPIHAMLQPPGKGKSGEPELARKMLEDVLQRVIETHGGRASIEAMFKSSKQVLEIQKQQHWCQGSIEKLAPWVWMMQSMIAYWYLTAGRKLPEARAARRQLGNWETEWSFRHMCRLLRGITIRDVIRTMSHNKHDLQQLAELLENYLYLAA